MKRILLIISCLLVSVLLNGCSSSHTEEQINEENSINEIELYQKFLNDKINATIHTQYYGDNENLAVDASDVEFMNTYEDEIKAYQNSRQIGDTLTFSDLKQYVKDEYGDDIWSDYACISYAYITCGGNDHETLILHFTGTDETSDGDITFVIDEEEGTLYVTYSFASWSRHSVELTSSGLVSGIGSSGAGASCVWLGVLDTDAIYRSVFSEDIYSGAWIGMNMDSVSNIYGQIFGEEDVSLAIHQYFIGEEKYYTYEIDTTENSELNKINQFISFCNLTWSTEKEIEALIAQRKEELKISDDVYNNDTSVDWIPLDTVTSENQKNDSIENALDDTTENVEEEKVSYSLIDYFEMTLDEVTSILGSEYQCSEYDGCWRISYGDEGYFLFEQESSENITGSENIIYMLFNIGENPKTKYITPTISAPLYYSDIQKISIASDFDYVDTSGDSMYAAYIEYTDNSGHTIIFGWSPDSDPYSAPVDCVEIY